MNRFDHFVLRVSDFDAASVFYRTLFTFAELTEVLDPNAPRSLGFQSADGFTLWLEEHPGLTVDDQSGGSQLGWLDHFALFCETQAEVNRAYAFCQSQDWVIITEPRGYPEYGSFYGFSFRGPDGIKLEFVTR